MINSRHGNTGLRIIVFMGAATFLFLMLMAFGLKKSLQAPAGALVPPGKATSPFSDDRAWEDVERITSIDTTLSGPASTNALIEFVAARLSQCRLRTRDFSSSAGDGNQSKPSRSIAGIVEGNRPGVLIVCTTISAPSADQHLASRDAADLAWLLETARILGPTRDGRSIWILFVNDGTSAVPGPEESNHRSGQSIVDALKASNELDEIDAVVCVKGIGDCLLSVQKDAGAPRDLSEIIWNTASRQGYGKFFGKLPARLHDSELSFRDAGIPAIALVDTSRDQAQAMNSSEPGNTCRESLRVVGDVIYHALAPLEGHLDGTGMRSDGH